MLTEKLRWKKEVTHQENNVKIVVGCIVLMGVCVNVIMNRDGEKLLSDIIYDDEIIQERFEQLFPNYDYSVKSSSREKDMRKKKRMKTMY